jgi:hypothetical protein
MSTTSIEDLKKRVINLNELKDSYVVKKLESEDGENDEKELVTSLVYVIADLRSVANNLGISSDGKFSVVTEEIKEFNFINEGVRNLKTQIQFLTKASVSEILNEMKIQKDKAALLAKENNKINTNVDSKADATRLRLQAKLNAKNSLKEIKEDEEREANEEKE